MSNTAEKWIVQKSEILTTTIRGNPEDLPVEILRANLHNKASCRWVEDFLGTANSDQVHKMNLRLDLEEIALKEALAILKENQERINKAVKEGGK